MIHEPINWEIDYSTYHSSPDPEGYFRGPSGQLYKHLTETEIKAIEARETARLAKIAAGSEFTY